MTPRQGSTVVMFVLGTLALVTTTPGSSASGPGITNGLRADPHDPSIVYAVASGGLFRSTDFAATWTRLGGDALLDVVDVAVHPTEPGVVFALSGTGSPPLVRSTDGGLTFEPLGSGFPSDRPSGYRSLALVGSDTVTVYVARESLGDEGWGLYASTDGGATFQEVTGSLPPELVPHLVLDLGPDHPTGGADVALGRRAFQDRSLHGLGGNGRSCADCHMPRHDTFQLSPADARERFDALMAKREHDPHADDPLFRPIDADDFRSKGNDASDYSNLTELGLIRVTLPLPSNVKLIDPATNQPSNETFVDVWRAVPPLQNVRITGPDGVAPSAPRGPNPAGGYQLDARAATLQGQALGAMVAHAQIEAPPSPELLDQIAAFEGTIFSSRRVRALADAMEAGTTPLPDPDPPLTPLEREGKAVFIRACGQCHGNDGSHPSQSTPINQVFSTTTPPALARYHNIRDTCPRPAGFGFAQCSAQMMKNVRTYEVTQGAVKQRITTSDPGRGLLTGNAADFGTFDVPQLRGISRTAPYFHNNSAATLEDMLDLYDAFFRFVTANAPNAPILTTDGVNRDRPPTPAERAALLAYLRKL